MTTSTSGTTTSAKPNKKEYQPRAYGEWIRWGLQRQDMTLKQLASAIGVSYESVRRAANGDSVISRNLSDAIAETLGLQADKMWRLQMNGKLKKKLGPGFLTTLPQLADTRLVEAWERLNDQQREKVLRIVEALQLENSISMAQDDAITAVGPPKIQAMPAAPPAEPELKPTPVDDALIFFQQAMEPTPGPVQPVAANCTTDASVPQPKTKRSSSIRSESSPLLTIEEARVFLRLGSNGSAQSWLRRHKIPKTSGCARVHKENLNRVLAGLTPLPLTAFVKR